MQFSVPVLIVIGLVLNIPFPFEGQAKETQDENQEVGFFVPPKEAYLVGYGDTLSIDVWSGHTREVALSNDYSVFSSGNIEMPMLGKFSVSNRSLEDITTLITLMLGKRYIKDPHVSIQIKQYGAQTIHVLGAVDKPGSFLMQGPMSLVEALAKAQGTNPEDKGEKQVKVIREDGKIILVDLNVMFQDGTGNLPLRSGDVIFVMEGQFVVVNGKVHKPGTIPWRGGMTITEAIAETGGALQEANIREVYIIRNTERIPVNVKKILQGRLPDVLLEQGDKVFLEESFW
jgi:polysaccharide biosynthesis/export protein